MNKYLPLLLILSIMFSGCSNLDEESYTEADVLEYDITKDDMVSKLQNLYINSKFLTTNDIIDINVEDDPLNTESTLTFKNILIAYGGTTSRYIYIMSEYYTSNGQSGEGVVLYLDTDNNISTGRTIGNTIGADYKLSTAGYVEYNSDGTKNFTYSTGTFSSSLSGKAYTTTSSAVAGYNLDLITNLTIDFNNTKAVLRREDNVENGIIEAYGQTKPFVLIKSYQD